MVTKRSLNKLERKAHMNIHVTKEVVDGEEAPSRYTRDRFGKKHGVFAANPRASKTASAVLAAFFILPFLAAGAFAGPNVNMTVESSEIDSNAFDQKSGEDERLTFYDDENTRIGFNEDGDPALAQRF